MGLEDFKRVTTIEKENAMIQTSATQQGKNWSALNAIRPFHAISSKVELSELRGPITATNRRPIALSLRPATSLVSVSIITRAAAIGIAVALLALSASAQTARDVKGATPLVAIQDEAPAKLIVDPPIPGQLALGRVFIQYRTENLRILPVFGKAALTVSPRVGHLHYYVDQQYWPTVDTSGETVVLVGLAPGPHQVRLELADATHKAIPGASKLVEFTVPAPKESQN
jgi:hypothetical protein